MGHIHEQIDFTAEVFIVYQDKLLLRWHEKFNIWLSVGGHIELDENPNQAAIREVKEEVGLDVTLWEGNKRFTSVEHTYTDIIPPVALAVHEVNDVHKHVVLVYFGSVASDAVIPEKPDDKWRWVTRSELAEMDLRPNVRYYAEAALDELSIE